MIERRRYEWKKKIWLKEEDMNERRRYEWMGEGKKKI